MRKRSTPACSRSWSWSGAGGEVVWYPGAVCRGRSSTARRWSASASATCPIIMGASRPPREVVLAGLGGAESLNNEVMAVGGGKGMSTFYELLCPPGPCPRRRLPRLPGLHSSVLGGDARSGGDVVLGRISISLGRKTPPPSQPSSFRPARRTSTATSATTATRASATACATAGLPATAWLSEHVLGVSVVEPGCKAVKIEPHLGGLQWAEGTYPTPHGVIKIPPRKAARRHGSVQRRGAPPGVKIVDD